MLAIELVSDPATKEPAPELATASSTRHRRGLLLLKAGVYGNCIRVLVPLVITDAELDEALGVWEEALEPRRSFLTAPQPPNATCRSMVGTSSRTGTSSRSSSARAGCPASIARTTGCSSRKVAVKILHEQSAATGAGRALPARGARGREARPLEHRHA